MRILDGRDYFYQWDLNVFIVSEDFDTESEVHFENKFSRGALSLKATTLNGQTVVEVPNIMLQLSAPIKAYLYIQDECGHRTIKEKVFEVKKRAKPVDYIYTEVESLTVSDYVKKALEEAKESGEFDGADGKDGVDGKDGANGNDGADGKDGTNGVDGKDGADGKDGSDGLTPFIGENGNWWIGETDTGTKAEGVDGKNGIDGKDGADGKNGLDGKDGQNGADGYTPVRGKDYWTPEDEAKIKADVETMVGDIDSVLDAIIAKQTEVLGGDS